MAEKDIKKTPAATQTVQPSADKYLEFLANVQ